MIGPGRQKLFGVVILLVLFFLPARACSAVLSARLEGTVGVAMEAFVEDVLERASVEKSDLVVFHLDTPGGLVSSMRTIVSRILESPVPVVVWVAPQGARAASAGAFLLQAAHVAAMAPGTNTGAAHPVMASGKDAPSEEMSRKVTNDLSAHMRSLAQLRGRNASLAERMVLESVSLSGEEALGVGIVDILASDIPSLLTALRGRSVTVRGTETVLDPSDEVTEISMTLRERVLQFVSSPDTAYLLLTAGVLAIVFEVLSPGGFVLGTAGAVMLLMGAFGLRMLPFNWAGLLLLLAGVAVLVLDLLVGGMGILSLFGAAAIVMSGLILFRTPDGELLNVSARFLAGVSAALVLFSLAMLYLILKSQRRRAVSGKEGLVGALVEVTQDIDPTGLVRCHGELWSARSCSGEVMRKGEQGVVESVEGIILVIGSTDRKSEKEVS